MAACGSGGYGSQWPEWMKPGVRVVRGPDWRNTIRDPKAADLGTLCYVPKNAGDNKVLVVWDTGQERRYNSGFKGPYELRAYDTQQVGIKHQSVKCKGCNMQPLRGIRFSCSQCKGVDLCVTCYSKDEHDVGHSFIRYDLPNQGSISLPARKNSKALKLMGVFLKSEVIRGPHWSYTGSDGGDCTKGIIQAFVDEKDGLANAWVRVKWEIGHDVKEYRFGVGGYVDVVASKVVNGGKVYCDHLPVIGLIRVRPGDKVSVNESLEDFKKAQVKGNVPGGWTDKMKQCLQETGTAIESLFEDLMTKVQYKDGSEYIVMTSVLYRVAGFREGDAVVIIKDKKMLSKLQEGHGSVPKDMLNACGQLGRLLKIQRDGDLEVLVGGNKYVFNPTACTPVDDKNIASKAPPVPSSDSESEESDDEPDGDMVPGRRLIISSDKKEDSKKNLKDFSEDFGSCVSNMKRNQDPDSSGASMFEAFTKADLNAVGNIIKDNPNLVDQKVDGGRSILHLSCHEGYTNLVQLLIDSGADMMSQDDDGDTPLHFAAFGKQPDCVRELLQNAADPNIQDYNGFTPLHVSVDHPDLDSILYLIQHNSDVTLKTKDGETVMHTAVEQKECQPTIAEAVLKAPSADFSLTNGNNFNVLHWAVFKECRPAVQIIIEKDPGIIDVPFSSDGFSALHIAAANDFVDLAGLLLGQGGANPNFKDAEGRTPLHLAVSQQHKRSMDLLLEKNADVNAQDKNGDTPLHLSQRSKQEKLSASRSSKTWSNDTNIQIVYFLLEKGADLHIKNSVGETPIDLIRDPKMKDIVLKLTAAYKTAPAKSQNGIRLPMHWRKMNLNDIDFVELDTSNAAQAEEHANICKHFKHTLPDCEIGCVKRLQNAMLWEHYSLKKREMEQTLGAGGANEMHLYHGTKPELVDLIACDNFDFRMAGERTGALYGDGAYFASTSKYSDLYASTNDRGFKVMFVAKVLVGKTCLGRSGLKKPPAIDENNPRKGYYDAVVNNILNPTIYCVFDRNQYYPEYIVEYR
ncbi:polymerase member 15 [Mactra antiquata]